MKPIILGVESDLGVHIDGAKYGPTFILNDIKSMYNNEVIEIKSNPNYIKSKDSNDLRKNENEINSLNKSVYKIITKKISEEYFPITIGGDHSISIASALGSAKKYENIGIIWIDAHTDYNTFDTTITGNIHGLPLATITGYGCKELRTFHNGSTINPANCVVVGARSIDKDELINVKKSGITVFSTEDIRCNGVNEIMSKAFEVAGNNTNKIHISFDLDIIDPSYAPGVSVPEIEGITDEEAIKIINFIAKNIEKVSAFDIVEFNPLFDINNKTKNIASNLLTTILKQLND